jgi:DNA repair exonuclease SbcCD ATPase subunit
MKTYVILPLLAVIIFGAIYWNFERGYEAQAAEARRQALIEKENKLKAEAEARARGVEEALQLQARRKKAREERDAREKSQKETRQAAIDARDKIHRDVEKTARQIDRLKKEIAEEKKALAGIEDDHKATLAEQDFIKNHIAQAEANLRDLEAIITRLSQAPTVAVAPASAVAQKH